MDFEQLYSQLNPWLLTQGPKILGIIIVAYLLKRFSHIFIDKFIRKAVRRAYHGSGISEKQREDTLIQIFSTTFSIAVIIVTFLIILAEIGIDTTPLIASAGIAGVALGFGAQYLIRDLITGFFVILENQYRVGDVVCFDKTCGSVEQITLRTTTLRDLDGTVHTVPNGEIKIASNLTKDFSRINLDIGVAYDSDIDKVIEIVNKTGEDMAKDKEWKDDIISPPVFLRVNGFTESAVTIKILGDTVPLRQWAVAGEYRKRLKEAFDKNKIEIPLPQRVIHTKKS